MAELLGEHWSGQVNDIIGWNVSWDISWCLLSSSPLAWSDTSSISWGLDASSNGLDVIGHNSWEAVVLIWDQGFSATPCAATSALSGALW